YNNNHERESCTKEYMEKSKKMLYICIKYFYSMMDEMYDEVTILYKEVKSLKTDIKEQLLEQERSKVQMLKEAILNCLPEKATNIEAELLANNIFVQGHMWGFRRWTLSKQYTIDEYIHMQLRFLFTMLKSEAEFEEA